MVKLTPLARAQEMLGDPVAARLLELLHARYKNARAKGFPSTPQSYHDLMQATAFSFKQVKRGLRVLRDRTGVASEQHLFHGKNIAHYKVPDQLGLYLEGQLPPSPTTPKGQREQTPEGQLRVSTQLSSRELSTKYSEALPNGIAPQEPEAEIEGVSGEDKEADMVHKMSDVEKQIVGKQLAQGAPKPNTTDSLKYLWLRKIAAQTKGFVAFTEKDRGMLGKFRKKCPPETSDRVLAWALDNWSLFTHTVQADVGLKIVPEKPAIYFALLYAGNAVGMALKVKAAPTQAAGMPVVANALQSISPTTPKTVYANMSAKLQAQNPEKKYPTWEELNAKPDEES